MGGHIDRRNGERDRYLLYNQYMLVIMVLCMVQNCCPARAKYIDLGEKVNFDSYILNFGDFYAR